MPVAGQGAEEPGKLRELPRFLLVSGSGFSAPATLPLTPPLPLSSFTQA